jgi:biotin synthase
MDRTTLLHWLREDATAKLEPLFALAEAARRASVGDAVYLRGLVEVSSHCVRSCTYCGLRAGNRAVSRYRLDAEEVLTCARQIGAFGCGTIVLQSGEDPGLSVDWVADVVRRVRDEVGLTVTLSLGERTPGELRRWRAAGADRYLLRFETSNEQLYRRVHPPLRAGEVRREVLLRELRELGYEIGSGVMVGLPGSTFEDLASDLLAFRALDLDMIGVGPFLPHPRTPLGRRSGAAVPDQVPNDVLTTCKTVALARLLCPRANIPATTALATLDPEGRADGLRAGANVWMPNFTPARYRPSYEVYPGKGTAGHLESTHAGLVDTLTRLGRHIGQGPGTSPAHAARAALPPEASCSPCRTSSAATP